MDSRTRFEMELNNPGFDEDYLAKLSALSEAEREDSFYTDLSFGTAGIRGKMGVGPNRLHKYTIRKVSYAVARYCLDLSDQPSIVIAFDSRNNSVEFSQEAAATLASQGIKVYLFASVTSTPELSFAVRYLGATAGIVITASHNPKEYNGYKVYHSSGRQVLQAEADAILTYYDQIEDVLAIEVQPFEDLLIQRRIEWTPEAVTGAFDDTIQEAVKDPAVRNHAADLRVVFTPLHGTGGRGVIRALEGLGVKEVYSVESQLEPDGDFPEVSVPNPEDPAVFERARDLGDEVGADILIATDPDADRIGAMVRQGEDYVLIDGNQMGAIMLDYLLEKGYRGEVITTIVSSQIVDKIAGEYKAPVIRTLTGFKYIGEQMNQGNPFLLGFEESYGYLNFPHVRDKDAINAACLICEMAISAKREGLTLLDKLYAIFDRTGYYLEDQIVLTLEGSEGQAKIASLMEQFRETGLGELHGKKLLRSIDYLVDETGLPKENVLKWIFEDDYWVAMRPSGTEPKLKIYVGVTGDSTERANFNLREAEFELNELLER
ncbi:MAG TPA: phospho-sugar mutase [Tissierellia bacterium]|nr:phospho-sugar mutase [Tissierellia bacterium]